MKWPGTIVVSRTDSIGDVMLTLPLLGRLRAHYPKARLVFLGRSYTAPVLRRCRHIDVVLTMEQLMEEHGGNAVDRLRSLQADAILHVFPDRQVAQWAKAAGIPHRIGTSHRWWHWFTVNERVNFSRRNSELHEAQLNLKLLEPFGITTIPNLAQLASDTGFGPIDPDPAIAELLRPGRRHVLIHPGSKGSAAEWGLDRFTELIRLLSPAQYQVILTGTQAEAESYRKHLPMGSVHVTDTGGRLSLDGLIALIGASDAMVAASTGPLHIAAAAGIRAIGLFPTQRPMHPGRWAPLGRDVHILVDEAHDHLDANAQVHAIDPERVLPLLDQLRPRA
ncbi:MAG: glycosyltransferase family 9 protein [Flavobacteriales bacterium]